MTQEFLFEDKIEFLNKLQELVKRGVAQRDIMVMSPYPVEEADEILHSPPSRLRFFTLIGAITGLIVGFAFTMLDHILSVASWTRNRF